MGNLRLAPWIPALAALLLAGLWAETALASHAQVPINQTQQNADGSSLPTGGTTNNTAVRLRGTSAGGTCGCGPYWLQYEVIPTSQSYSGSPNYTSPPTANNNCTNTVYQWTGISGLIAGTSYKWRVREYAQCSGFLSSWSQFANPAFTVQSASQNTAPSASAQSVTTNEDTNKAITLGGSDPEGDSLTYNITAAPSNGSLSGLPPNVTYAPNSNFHGSDSFAFKTNDGEFDSSAATVSITVNSVNDAPVTSGQSLSMVEDGTAGVTFVGSDADGDALTWSIVNTPSHGSVSGGSGASRIYTPSSDFNGNDSFTFKANDGSADSSTETISISIAAVNDPPTAGSGSLTATEDTPRVINLQGSDPEGSALTYTITSGPSHGTLTANATNPAYTYIPNVNFNGNDVFTYLANDGTSNSNNAMVSIIVVPVNDEPVANNQAVTTTEDTAVGITLVATDVDVDTLTYTVVTQPGQGTLSGIGASLTYTSPSDWSGSTSFTFKVNDGTEDSNTATVTITVGASNDAPVASNQSQSTAEDTAASLTLSASDNDATSLTYTLVTNPSNGTLTTNPSAPAYSYTPNLNFNGSDSFTWRASDGTTNSNTATFTLTVTPANDAPVANAQTAIALEDTNTSLSLSATDLDGDALTYSIVTSPANGTLTGTGSLRTYLADSNYTGADSFTFKANDGTLDSNAATVSITVAAVSDPPTADPQSVSTTEDVALPITLSGSDGDGDTLTFSVISGPFNGTLSGTLPNVIYTPNADYSGSDLFSFQSHDGASASPSVPVAIAISAVNDAPVAASQSVTVDEDDTKAVTLAAIDVEETPLTYTLVTSPANGTLLGTIPDLVYAPNPNFNGSDSFTFQASDGALPSNVATVSLTVTDINDLPAAAAGGPYVGYEGSPVALDGTACSDVDGMVMTWMWDCESDGVFDVNSTSGSGDTCTYAEDGTYTLKLLVIDNDGDEAVQTATVTVHNVAPVITSMVTPGGVEGFMLQFSATATDPGPDTFTYHWDFGNGSTPATGAVQHTYYANDGDYTVTLTVTDDDGGVSVQTALVAITNAPPTILGLSGDVTGDEGALLSWTALGADPGSDTLTYSWDFGDGTQATGQSATHTYADDGAYTLTLTLSDGGGGVSTDTLSIAVANVAPTVTDLTGDSSGDEGDLLSWAVSATDPGADVLTYSWDFGDGSPTDTGTAASHTYLDEGSYTLVVTVTDDDGGSTTETLVVPVANVAPTALLAGDQSGVEGDLLSWNVVAGDAGVNDTLSYAWDFGDGSPVVINGTTAEAHVYSDEGSFLLQVTVTDNGGASTTEILAVVISNAAPQLILMQAPSGDEGDLLTFTAQATDSGNDTLLYTWDFGDGSSQLSGDSVTYAYGDNGSYSVTVTVDDGDGGSVSLSVVVAIANVAPVIDSVAGPATGLEGDALQWTVQASDAGTDDTLSYAWDFGDGSAVESGASPSHSYSDEGQYTITVVAADDDGASVSATTVVQVLNVAPTIVSITAPQGDEGSVAVMLAVATDPGADSLSYSWDLGDGSPTLSGPTQSHTYQDDGVFVITVTVDDGDGGTAVGTSFATIANVAPEITTLSVPAGGDEGALITFEVQAADVGLGDLPDLVATWDFGDGTASVTGASVQHAFVDDGVYSVSVTVDDQDGGSDSDGASVTIDNVAPQILSSAPAYGSEGLQYNYELVILDPGAEEFILTLSGSSPATMTVDSAAARINWTPVYADTLLGPVPVTVTVDDGDGGTVVQTWTIQVGFADDDGDGMADQWELDNGFDPTLDDGGLDPDVDGVSTYQEFLDGTDPNGFDGPGAPVAVSPVDGEEVDSDVPFLTWNNSFDPQLDELRYDVQVWADAAMTNLIREEILVDENGWFESWWKVTPPLDENSTCFWRVRAKDAEAYGPYSDLEEFFVNAVSEPPEAPVPLWPLDGDMVADEDLELSWAFAVEPDQDAVTYSVAVFDDAGGLLSEASEIVEPEQELAVIWLVDVVLEEDRWYSWQVSAVDEDGLQGDWSEAQDFYYSLDNAAPYDVYFIWPQSDDLVESLVPTLVASSGYDPEGQELRYEFELDGLASFDSEELLSTDLLTTGDTVSWDLLEDGHLLVENQWYFARVRGVDPGEVGSPWDTISFMVHGVNEAPPVPELVNPADGVEVGDSRPTLVAWNVEDPEDDMVFYDFLVSRDLQLSEVTASVEGVMLGGGGAAEGHTAWTVDQALAGDYFWAARAVDAQGAASAWSEVRSLRVGATEPDIGGTAPAAGCDCEASLSGGRLSPNLWALLLLAFAGSRRRRGQPELSA